MIGFASHCFGWLIGLVRLLSPPEIPNKIRVPTVRFLSVNGEQKEAKRGSTRGSFSSVSLHLRVCRE